MIDQVPVMFHLIIVLSLVFSAGGLIGGMKIRHRDVDDAVKLTFAWGGMIVGCIDALIMSSNSQMTPIGYEIGGLVLCLSLMIGFLGFGLLIGPYKGE